MNLSFDQKSQLYQNLLASQSPVANSSMRRDRANTFNSSVGDQSFIERSSRMKPIDEAAGRNVLSHGPLTQFNLVSERAI